MTPSKMMVSVAFPDGQVEDFDRDEIMASNDEEWLASIVNDVGDAVFEMTDRYRLGVDLGEINVPFRDKIKVYGSVAGWARTRLRIIRREKAEKGDTAAMLIEGQAKALQAKDVKIVEYKSENAHLKARIEELEGKA